MRGNYNKLKTTFETTGLYSLLLGINYVCAEFKENPYTILTQDACLLLTKRHSLESQAGIILYMFVLLVFYWQKLAIYDDKKIYFTL